MSGPGVPIALRLQAQLTRIYEIETEHSVGEFLVSDKNVARAFEGDGGRDIPEKLLVREHEDGMDLALYIDRDVLGRLDASDPTKLLTPDNLGDYWTLLEGVSHFVYLTFNAARERSVTLLELELQAEVDKFAATFFQLGKQDGQVPRDLGAMLFERIEFDASLDADGRERYETANRSAMVYCEKLLRLFRDGRVDRSTMRSFVEALRRFYRLPQEEKLRASAGA